MWCSETTKVAPTLALVLPSTSTRWTMSARRGTVIAGGPAGAFPIPRERRIDPAIPSRLMRDLDDNSTANFAFKDFRRQIRQSGQWHSLSHLFEAIERQIAGKTLPCFDPLLARTHHRIDPEQVDAAQQERNHRGRQIAAAGEATDGDTRAIFELGQDRRQGGAANRVDGTGPAFAVERARRLCGEARAVDQIGGAQLSQIFPQLGPAGRSYDPVPEPRQQRHRNAADPTRRAGDQDITGSGMQPVPFERYDREHRGEPGSAYRHRLAGVQSFRPPHQV